MRNSQVYLTNIPLPYTQGHIAQWLEHLYAMEKVPGSNPGLVTFIMFNNGFSIGLSRVIMNTQGALGGCRTPGDVMVKVLSMSIMQ